MSKEKYGTLNHLIIDLAGKLFLSGNVVLIGDGKDALLIKWIILNKYLPEEEIKKAVHERICKLGRRGYEWCIEDTSRYPNCVPSRNALGFAIKNGELSILEIAKIKFDHGETLQDYMLLAENFLNVVIKQLASFSLSVPEYIVTNPRELEGFVSRRY